MRSLLVVVADVAAQQPQKMEPAEHQRPVQTLCANSLEPPLDAGVRLRRPDRGLEDLSALAPEYVVEEASELGVVVAQQNLTDTPRSFAGYAEDDKPPRALDRTGSRVASWWRPRERSREPSALARAALPGMVAVGALDVSGTPWSYRGDVRHQQRSR